MLVFNVILFVHVLPCYLVRRSRSLPCSDGCGKYIPIPFPTQIDTTLPLRRKQYRATQIFQDSYNLIYLSQQPKATRPALEG